MKRFREWIESIIFAGMKPSGGKNAQPLLRANTFWGRLRQKFDTMLAGGAAPNDPLYLSNRTWTQKVRSWGVITIPLLVLVAGVGLVLSGYLDPPDVKPQK